MKKIFVVISLLIVSMAANAQFERGKVLINASLSGASLSYSSQEKGHFGLEANTGYFIVDNVALTSTIGMSLNDNVDAYHFGIGGRYYFDNCGIFVGGGLKATDYNYKDASDVNDFALTAECGYAFFISKKITVEPCAYYDFSLKDSDYSKLGVMVGFSLYF